MSGQARPVNDTAVNVGLGLLTAVAVLAGLLRAAGSIAARLAGATQPSGGLAAGLTVLAHPTRPAAGLRAPGLSPLAYWPVVAGLLVAAGGIAYLTVRLVRSQRGGGSGSRDIHSSTSASPRRSGRDRLFDLGEYSSSGAGACDLMSTRSL
ncbi:MAG: hypothetical protein ACYCUM_14155 [Solirubrobacteraceae bacterium]